jgi:VCBS repeat-containing protein
VDFGYEPEGGEFDPAPPPPPPQPGSSDPQHIPQGGFTGDDFGSVEEDGTTTTTGQLVFAGGTGLIQPLVIQGTYGTFVIDADGNWVYTLDNDSDAVQSLGEGDSVEETFAVVSSDGSETQFVTITVQGVNDVPTVTGTTTGAVVEDGTQVATGTITVDDPDAGESSVQPQSNVAGTYGTFSILANGNWTYILDNADPAVQALAEGETVTDSFTVTSFDGTATETVTITVTGTNDVPTVTGTTTGAVVEDGTQVATGTITVDDPDAGESSVQPLSNVAGTYGTFSILANGNWTYTLDNADPAVQALAEGETVTDSFIVTSFDGSATETIEITITGTNDVPTVTGTTTGDVVEDGTLVATGTITVSDPDAGESSVQPLSNVAGTYGTFSILADGNWTYILDNADPAVQGLAEGETVTDTFTVTSFDGTVTETGHRHGDRDQRCAGGAER